MILSHDSPVNQCSDKPKFLPFEYCARQCRAMNPQINDAVNIAFNVGLIVRWVRSYVVVKHSIKTFLVKKKPSFMSPSLCGIKLSADISWCQFFANIPALFA